MKLTATEQELQEMTTQMFLSSGANMLLSRVGATLFNEPREISLEELSERTGYSLPSVSNAVKYLEQAGKIIRHKKPGDKRSYVSFRHDLVGNMREQINKGRHTIIKPMQERMPRFINQLREELKSNNYNKEKKEDLKKKIEWYSCYLLQIKTLEEIFEKIDRLFDEVESHEKTHH